MSDDEIASMDAGLRRMFSVGYFDIASGQMVARYVPKQGVPAMVGTWHGKIAVYLLPPEEDK
jgi:hypothetical protein